MDALHFESIPTALRTINIGHRNALVYKCDLCDYDLYGHTNEHLAGFGTYGNDTVVVIECPSCGERYWYHAPDNALMSYYATQARLRREQADGIQRTADDAGRARMLGMGMFGGE